MIDLPLLSQLPPDVATAVLVVLLIAAFVVAFKIMKMVFQTILVSVLSGVFYLALVFFFNYQFSLNNLLMFSFLGSSLYMAYSFLASAYSVASRLLEIPHKLIIYGLKPFKLVYRKVRDHYRMKRVKRSMDNSPGKKEEESQETREVVLDKVRSQDEDED